MPSGVLTAARADSVIRLLCAEGEAQRRELSAVTAPLRGDGLQRTADAIERQLAIRRARA